MTREGDCSDADCSFVIFKFNTIYRRFCGDGVDDLDTRCPVACTLGVPKVFGGREFGDRFTIRGMFSGIVQQLFSRGGCEGVIVGFNDVEEGVVRVLDESARCIRQRNDFLYKIVIESLDCEDSVISLGQHDVR